jgi:TolA-binding protein
VRSALGGSKLPPWSGDFVLDERRVIVGTPVHAPGHRPRFEGVVMKRTSVASAVVLLSVVLASSACVTTRAEGDQLRADVDALKDETAQLQKELTDIRARESGRVEKLGKRVAELEGTLSSLRQADADAGVQLEKVVAEVQALRGEIETAQHEIGQQKATVESILARPPVAVATAVTAPKVQEDASRPLQLGGVDVPADARGHYDFAKRFYDEKRFAIAAEAFDLFLSRHAREEDLLDNAAYWKAESFYQLAAQATDKSGREKAYKQAILSYQRVLESPRSEKADGALLKIGLSFEQLGFADEARVFYEELIAKHAKSPLVGDARKRLAALKTPPKKKR